MILKTWTLATAVVGLAAASPALATDPTAVDGLFGRLEATGPGCAVGLYERGRAPQLRGYGLADLGRDIPIGPDTLFNIGSDTKQFTAFAALRLAAENRLSLDDDVRRYIPELPFNAQTVTVRDLLHHSSGIVDYYEIWAIAGYPSAVTTEQALASVSRLSSLNFAPGTSYMYSNSNYMLLGEIIARVTGGSLAEHLRETLFEPLGMTRTRLAASLGELPAQRAVTYRRGADALVPQQPGDFVVGASGIYSSVRDLALWHRSLAERSMAPRAVYEAFFSAGRLRDGTDIIFAPGNELRIANGQRVLAHGGESGGYISYVYHAPDIGFGGAILCNTAEFQPPGEALVRQRLPTYSEAGAAPGGVVDDPMAFAGLYRFDDGSTMRLQPVDDELRLNGLERFPLRHVAGRRYRLGAIPVFLDLGRSADGVPTLVQNLFGLAPIRGRRVAQAAPTPQQLLSLAGNYSNADLGVTLRLTADGDTLRLERPGADTAVLEPRSTDAFYAPELDLFLSFERDSAGRPSRLLYTSGSLRTRLLPFARDGAS